MINMHKWLIPLALGTATAASTASEIVFEQNTGSEITNSGFGFSTSHWVSMEVSLGGSLRSDPTIALDLFDAYIGAREVTMHLYAGDGTGSHLADSSSAFASQTVTTGDLGADVAHSTSVSWNFDGVTLPDDIVIALEVADADGSGATIFASVFGDSGSAPLTGTNLGFNRSNNNGLSWFYDDGNLSQFSFANFTITAVPLPAASLAGLGLLAGLGTYRRLRR